jgi:hypothetical protein
MKNSSLFNLFHADIIKDIFEHLRKEEAKMLLNKDRSYSLLKLFYSTYTFDIKELINENAYINESVRKNVRKITGVNNLDEVVLFEHLTHLTFDEDFNQPVNNLPQGLTPLEESRRSWLTHLTFGRNFNQEVDNLPQSLTHLKESSWYLLKIQT